MFVQILMRSRWCVPLCASSRIMDEYSFTAADQPVGTRIEIGVEYVREKIKPLLKNTDLSKYVL
jgi:ATP-dependent protease HslVU (ClpYQ) ATPase subunit